jgi:hypothetical protein
LDKIIHKHLDNRLDLQEASTKMMDGVLSDISIKSILKDPTGELARIAHIAMGITETFANDAAKEGLRFASDVKKKGVSFAESDDSKLNEEDFSSDN